MEALWKVLYIIVFQYYLHRMLLSYVNENCLYFGSWFVTWLVGPEQRNVWYEAEKDCRGEEMCESGHGKWKVIHKLWTRGKKIETRGFEQRKYCVRRLKKKSSEWLGDSSVTKVLPHKHEDKDWVPRTQGNWIWEQVCITLVLLQPHGM